MKQIILGQPSWCVRSATVEAFVTETGGHLAPVTFDRTGRRIPVAEVPRGFAAVKDIEPVLDGEQVKIFPTSGRAIAVPLRHEFLRSGLI